MAILQALPASTPVQEQEPQEERDVEAATPQAVPTSVQPVYIQIIPFGEHNPNFLIASGYSAYENPEIHRLSKIVLQLAMTNFALSFLLELIVLVAAIFKKKYIHVVYFVFWSSFSYYVMWLGIQGVKTRNESCCSCERDCGYLDAFRSIYVLLSVLRAIMLFISIILLDTTEIVFNLLFLLLLTATADYARRLLDKIHELESLNFIFGQATASTAGRANNSDPTSPHDTLSMHQAPAATAIVDTIPMAAARPIADYNHETNQHLDSQQQQQHPQETNEDSQQ